MTPNPPEGAPAETSAAPSLSPAGLMYARPDAHLHPDRIDHAAGVVITVDGDRSR